MHYKFLFAFACLALPTTATAAPAKLTSVYGKLFDAPGCKVDAYAGGDDGPASEEHDCPGPIAGVRTILSTGSDWDHLAVVMDKKHYTLWEPMVAVGGFSGVGNRKGTIEWLFNSAKGRKRANLAGLIVRFEGAVMGADGNISGSRSQLAVFDLTAGKPCWRGNFNDNVSARNAAEAGTCKAPLQTIDDRVAG
jgi:hypothetical protein